MPLQSKEILTPIDRPELFFGFVGPIGADLKGVQKELEKRLGHVKYKCYRIRVTELLSVFKHDFEIKTDTPEDKYHSLITAGNNLRKLTGRMDIFSLLAIVKIRQIRDTSEYKNNKENGFGAAFILHQFKRSEEIKTLRTIYSESFIQLSVYSRKNNRVDNLTRQIADGNARQYRDDFYVTEAQRLIVRDEDEDEVECGQRMKSTFPMADIVIDAASITVIKENCDRLVRALFGYFYISPTKDEYGAYLASTAALRSVDLSRQVGAAAMTSRGEVISLGCNEVPKSGGGTYWETDNNDYRDFIRGFDYSTKFKKDIFLDALRRLKDDGLIDENKIKDGLNNLAEKLLFSDQRTHSADSLVMNLLEYGRIIHAEMNAISDAARMGLSLKGTTLYTTTFPCHMCARHIVGSGIARVIYLEPYSKSYAAELYPDSIAVDGEDKLPGATKVEFQQFVGVAPAIFERVFKKGRRKNLQGKALEWKENDAKPIIERFALEYRQVETRVLLSLKKLIDEKSLVLEDPILNDSDVES